DALVAVLFQSADLIAQRGLAGADRDAGRLAVGPDDGIFEVHVGEEALHLLVAFGIAVSAAVVLVTGVPEDAHGRAADLAHDLRDLFGITAVAGVLVL